LGKVKFSVQKRTLSKLAGFRHTGAKFATSLDQFRQENGITVAMEFQHILARIGFRPAKEQLDAGVDLLAFNIFEDGNLCNPLLWA
jgi:hypothetical protein